MCSGYAVGERHTAAMADRAEDHETLSPVIDIGISAMQLRHRFLDPNRHSGWCSDGPRTGPCGGSTTGPTESQRRANGRTWGTRTRGAGRGYGKIKSYLTYNGSRHPRFGSYEARPFRGTSWTARRRAARSVSHRGRSDYHPRCGRHANGERSPRHDPWPWPAREHSSDALHHRSADTERAH
jgi:hypothetical protein